MIIRCISRYLTEDQAERLGSPFQAGYNQWDLIPGNEYIVFGMSILPQGILVEVLSHHRYWLTDVGDLSSVPLCLFEIVDGHISRSWQARVLADGNLRLWHPSFFRPNFLIRLAEGDEEAVGEFREIRRLMEEEARADATHSSLR